MTQATKEQKADALKQLSDLRPGETVYTKLNHVSKSGMYRVIDLYVMRDNQPRRISWSAAALLEGYDDHPEGGKASGCGMDMGFHLVYNLSATLFRDGFDCIGELCPSNDHSNGIPRYPPHASSQVCDGCGTHQHRDGGYALVHRG